MDRRRSGGRRVVTAEPLRESMTAGSSSSALVEAVARDFETLERRLEDSPAAWTLPARRAAYARFRELGLPTTRWEEWRSTPVSALASAAFEPQSKEGALAESPASRLHVSPWVVVSNGHWAGADAPSSLPAGVLVMPLARALATERARLAPLFAAPPVDETRPFHLLNAALGEDGIFVLVPRGVVLAEPLTLPFVTLSRPVASHPRAVVVVEEGAQAVLAEVHSSSQGHPFSNALTDVLVAPGAQLEHVRLVEGGPQAFHVGSVRVRQEAGSTYVSHVISLGGALTRTEVDVTLAGEGASCTLNGLAVASLSEVVDHHTTVDHAVPHGTSRQLYKGIFAGRARGVFRGRVRVRRDAQGTDARQANRNLLLSTEALVDTKPQLEIEANDVKCAHGATIGRIDPLQLFYLRSRGLDEQLAREALTHAFAEDILGRLHHPALREHLQDVVGRALAAASRGAS